MSREKYLQKDATFFWGGATTRKQEVPMFQIVNRYHGPADWDGVSNFPSVSDQAVPVSSPTQLEDRDALQKNEWPIPDWLQSGAAGIWPLLLSGSRLGFRLGLLLGSLLGIGMCSFPLAKKLADGQKLNSSDWINFGKKVGIAGIGALLAIRWKQSLMERAVAEGYYTNARYSDVLWNFSIPTLVSLPLHKGLDYFLEG